MRSYQLGDFVIRTATALQTLVPADDVAAPPWDIQMADGLPPRGVRWYHRAVLPSRRSPWRSLGRLRRNHVVAFHGVATFIVDEQRRRIVGYPCDDVTPVVLEQVLLAQLMPLVFSTQGRAAIHGSAVIVDGLAAGFIGMPGQGKSTLATALAADGCPLLTDDCVLIDVQNAACFVVPLHTGIRLRADAVVTIAPGAVGTPTTAGKRRFEPAALRIPVAAARVPLSRLYLLEPSDPTRQPDVDIISVSSGEAVTALLTSAFQLGGDTPAALSRHFDELAAVVAAAPVCRLRFPRDFASLPRLVAAVRRQASR